MLSPVLAGTARGLGGVGESWVSFGAFGLVFPRVRGVHMASWSLLRDRTARKANSGQWQAVLSGRS